MKICKSLTIGILLSVGFLHDLQVNAAVTENTANKTDTKTKIQEGREYVTLVNPLVSQPNVIEFFSFYCHPCYLFIDSYPVSEAITRRLPDQKVVKYHVSVMGAMGNELTEAWAVAIVMGKTEQVEKPLFEAVRNKNMNSIDDIHSIFYQIGVDKEKYESTRQSLLVKEMVARQNTAVDAFNVKSTPTFYINGKYKINNSGIITTSPQAYVEGFVEVVDILLKKGL
uniref:Thiol:disulfide interchange protein n=1 Tax=Pectobacterium carotovorum TaxID=554 RepID=A0A0N9NM46_PECCA|nr:DsbA family protein [Pectobacterium carotovorum]ALG88710.1 Thiol:disulfide interchange protein DsbA precursor [Pectobacterium carotovorum]